MARVLHQDVETDPLEGGWVRGEPSAETVSDDIRAALRARIKRLPRSRKYPPDKSEQAVRLVIEQMEVLAPGYSGQPAEMSD